MGRNQFNKPLAKGVVVKILITGIAGFVGSTLARRLLSIGHGKHEITGIDNFSFGYRDRLADIVKFINFIECDVSEISERLGNENFDVIVHCAAIAPLPDCQIDSRRAIIENVANCGKIADFAMHSGTSNIVFFSSGAIYENIGIYPTPEDVTPRPKLVYPITKYIAEQYFQAVCAAHELNVVAIRLFNLYGPHQDYFRKQPPLIGYLLRCLIEKKQAVLFSSGNQRRDYVFIDDLVDFVLAAANYMCNLSETSERFLTVNAGTGVTISVNEIISLIEDISGEKLDIKRKTSEEYWNKYPELFERKIPLRKEIVGQEVEKFTHADIRKAFALLKWEPKVSMMQGLSECLEYAKSII